MRTLSLRTGEAMKQKRHCWQWVSFGVMLGLWVLGASAQEKNGFDLTHATVPASDIMRGGPPRDGIPALTNPGYQRPSEATLWRDDDLMLTYDVGADSFAYPVGILNWHEIVNDELHGQPILITFCPLCGTGMAFDPVVNGKLLTFGVSGLLYNSDLLMYDHQTESLWSQIKGEAIAGPLVGEKLTPVVVRHELWTQWTERAPQGQVLTTDTGWQRDYRRSPYGNYDHSERLYFPVSHSSRRYHPKTLVLGWEYNGEAKTWPFPELEKTNGPVKDTVGGQAVVVEYDSTVPTATLKKPDGEVIPATQAFWFAWFTFFPETSVYQAD